MALPIPKASISAGNADRVWLDPSALSQLRAVLPQVGELRPKRLLARGPTPVFSLRPRKTRSLPRKPSGPSLGQCHGLRFEPGSSFGVRYRIESLLGQGGMGAVYKAYDTELGRTVALKLVRPELAANPETMQRFKQELLLASKISHKNILRIYDLGDFDGIKFISMAFVEGCDLAGLIERTGRLALDRALRFTKQLCAAMDAAHREGVVHRDLKPQNILIDQADKLYVSDFGLAKSLAPEAATHDARGPAPGHAALHVARAGGRKGGGPSQRSVFAGSHHFRNVHGGGSLPRRVRAADHVPARDRGAQRSTNAASGPARLPGQHHPEVPGKGA